MKDKPVILVVDDEPQNIELLEAYLAPLGYEIVTAANGEEALVKLSGNKIDLILLDILMPGMDGFEVTRRIRQDNTHRLLPIILITVLWEKEDRVKGIEAGCDDFISKPVDKMELLARVRSLLKVKAYNDLMNNYQKELESEVTRRTKELKYAMENLQQEITERKRAGEALRKSEEKYRWVLDNMADVIVVMDMNLRFTYVSPSIMRMRGYTAEEATEQTLEQVMTPESLQISAEVFEEEMKLEASGTADPGRSRILEVEQYKKDGSIIWMENTLSFLRDDTQKAVGIISLTRDITDRKRAEEVLLEKTILLEAQSETSIDGILAVDNDGHTILLNKRFGELWKIPQHILDIKDDAKMLECVSIQLKDPVEFGHKVAYLYEHRTEKSREEIELADGRYLDRYSSPLLSTDGQYLGRIWFFRDVTDRKQSEEALKQSEERYRSIFENAQEGIFRSTPEGKMIMANQAMANMLGYESIEEGLASITDMVRQHYVNPEDHDKLKEMIEEHGFVKGYEAQLYRKDGSIIWISKTMRAVRDKKGHILYYDGMDEDITDRKEGAERMRKALRATVQAVAVTVERRDPYTAGHQRRVADLARAIATEMNVSEDQIDGIRLAATIHDLGKISVPAEILSKPTKLTNIEFNLIKTHSQSGYDILKDIEFPWPIARIVLEHHERMNGSGYPNGLTGDNILLESRIIAVADVVESMGSHRPYRPSLGIKAALEEIEKNRGTHYDNTVADACLKLFRVKSYQLAGVDYNW
jgi:PAS domain S-box-containing protein